MKRIKPPEQGKALFNKYFVSIVIISFVYDLCTRFFMGTIALHVDSLGATATLAGLMTSVFTLVAAVFRIIAGRFADTYSRKLTILAGLAGYAFATVALSMTTNLNVILVIRAAQGLFFAVGGAGFSIAVTDVIPENRMTEGIGYFGFASTLATAFGPMIAIFIMEASGFNTVVFTSTALCIISWSMTYFICNHEKDPLYAKVKPLPEADSASQGEEPASPPVTEKQEPLGFIWRYIEKRALPAAITNFFFILASGSVMGFIALYAKRLGFGNAGLFFMIQSIVAVAARVPTGKFADKHGPLYALIPGILSGLLGYALLIVTRISGISFLFYLSGALCGLGSGVALPTMTALAIRGVPAHRRGAAMGIYYTHVEVALALGTFIWGAMIDHVNYDAVYAGAALCCLISCVLAFGFFNKKSLMRRM